MTADYAALKAQQLSLAAEVVGEGLSRDFSPGFIAGGDVGFEQQGTIARGVIVVLRWPGLEIVEHRIARVPVTLPYIPGFLSFRECPALLAAWQQLTHRPDLLLIDGQGIAHPRGLGVASHIGVLADVPTIGIAKSRLYGEYSPLEEGAGACQPLYCHHQQAGWVLRSKIRCNPLFISVGHRVSVDMALFWTQQCLRGYRLPEPTRLADGIASRRKGFQRWLDVQ